MTNASTHWQKVWTDKTPDETSWFEHDPSTIERVLHHCEDSGSVIDIGGGASTLIDGLLDAGVADLCVLDVAESALARSRRRLGSRAASVNWVCADVNSWVPPRSWTVWHDRAAFHFQIDDDAGDRYLSVMARGVAPDGVAIITTFASDGPTQCSGLPVRRWSAEEFARHMPPTFELLESSRSTHLTPWEAEQSMVTMVCRRHSA